MSIREIYKEELQELRKQTSGTSRLIHFNNAGASMPPDVVVDTVVDYLRIEALEGGYETEAKCIDSINSVYDKIARLINANSSEIALFENASAAWGTAFKGLTFEEGDEIITSEMEYVTNVAGFADMKIRAGVTIKVIPNDKDGNFLLSKLERSISPKTKLIAVTHISSSGGCILPIEEIGAIAEKHGIFYLVDACQSVGQMPLDVKSIKCDVLSATGRKYLRAPRGTGFLFVRESSQHKLKPNLLDFVAAGNVSLSGYKLRQDARRFELYERSRALTLGLGKAVEYALEIGLDRIWDRIERLSTLIRKLLEAIPGIIIHDSGVKLSGIVTFSVEGMESLEVKGKLAARGINVSVGVSQATPIYMDHNKLSAVVRASIHYYNTEREIGAFCRELIMITKMQKDELESGG